MRVAIVGAGGHGKVVGDVLLAIGHELAGFLDDHRSSEWLLDRPVVAALDALPTFDCAIIAIGDNAVRKAKFEALDGVGVPFVTLVHPSAVVSPRARIGRGTLVAPGAIVMVDATIGDNVIVNTGASIDHDGEIESHVHLAPGTVLGGTVTVEQGAFLGIGVRAIPGRRIGAWAVVGAGSVVIRDVPAGARVAGVPAQPLTSSSASQPAGPSGLSTQTARVDKPHDGGTEAPGDAHQD